MAAAGSPNALIVFLEFRRVNVGLGFAMAASACGASICAGGVASTKVHGSCGAAVLMGPSGFAAVLAGWITTEVGRQPYTVSPSAHRAIVSAIEPWRWGRPSRRSSCLLALFGAGTFYILRLMNHAPHPSEPDLPAAAPMRASGIMPAPAMEARDTLPTH